MSEVGGVRVTRTITACLSLGIGASVAAQAPPSAPEAVEHYLDRLQIRDNGLRWSAFSRGVMLDSKRPLGELESTDTEWTVMPEVSAGRPA